MCLKGLLKPHKKIIIASSSPRRIELLKKLVGTEFSIKQAVFSEDNKRFKQPHKLVLHNAVNKVKSIKISSKKAVVIGADTIVYFQNMILGKPINSIQAKQFLKMMSNKKAVVYSGVAIYDNVSNTLISDYQKTAVYMNVYDEKMIDNYLAIGDSLDKAGAFAIQGIGSVFVKRIVGNYDNVVGLPIVKLLDMLKKVNALAI